MDNENIDKLTRIEFPNTAVGMDLCSYSKPTVSFKGIIKNGEMAGIQWIQIYEGEKLIAEIKESICNLFYN
jgi:hypothetical protein